LDDLPAFLVHFVDRTPVRNRWLPDLIQDVIQVGGMLEGGEQDGRPGAQAPGLGVPARKLDAGGGLALAGVGMQEHDRLSIEGAVEQEQRFIATDETGVRHVAEQRGVVLDGVEFGSLPVSGGRVGRQQLNRGGFINDGHEPVLQRAGQEPNPALGVPGQVFATGAGGLAKGAALGQPGVKLANVLRSGDHEDAVAHPQHGRDALVNDRLSQRADGPDFVMVVIGGGVRVGPGVMHGRLAGVERQHRHTSIVEQLAQLTAQHRPHLVVAGMLEQQVARPG
jgi:hypothetical protein